jgi:hypothetical protein
LNGPPQSFRNSTIHPWLVTYMDDGHIVSLFWDYGVAGK